KMPINWCPNCKIGLANEEVVDDKCERCGTEVEQKEKEQWMLAITKYADRLYDDLDEVDYPERVRTQQRNWIGQSEGAEIEFEIKNQKSKIKIFTTRPDTIFGATFLVKAGKKDKFTGEYAINPATKEKIPVWEAEYVMGDYGTGAIMAVPAHDERDFEFAKKHNLPIKEVVIPRLVDKHDPPVPGKKTVERTAVQILLIDPKTQKVLILKWKQFPWTTFITGGVEQGEELKEAAEREIREETGYKNFRYVKTLGRPIESHFHAAHKNENRKATFTGFIYELVDDEREEVSEEEKAIHDIYWLSWEELGKDKDIKCSEYETWVDRYFNPSHAWIGEGVLVDSGKFSGLRSEEARGKITERFGKKVVKYKLRDWIFSRQRYWGEPIPVVHCAKCGIVPVPEEDLPVMLPEVENYQPTDTGDSPLANISEWVNVKCPKCGGDAKRETDVMPNWAGSSWYFIAYLFSKEGFTNPTSIENWKLQIENFRHFMPVDWYNGGMEHTVLHLLYSRFWNKFLFDLKLAPTSEPYRKRTSHGLILAEGGEKMSKSKSNVINPDAIVKQFGADTLRVYEMFMGPFEQAIAWSESALIGPRRFLERVWKLQNRMQLSAHGQKGNSRPIASDSDALMHQTIKKVSDDIENIRFNTAISALMIYVNALDKQKQISKDEFEILLKLLAPFAPHITEELWSILGHKDSIHTQSWPIYDLKKIEKDGIFLAVQVNGKVRTSLAVSRGQSEDEIKAAALALQEVKKWLDGKEPKKIIVVPERVVSIVTTAKAG
ncbi:MAG: class I tRNA ligase family protein, partial [Candidatus Zambryskibacteria bacterium]|nr:class I tRNA ligase family protein [Candidatus Zambryskibacteria bacterium]